MSMYICMHMCIYVCIYICIYIELEKTKSNYDNNWAVVEKIEGGDGY
jgi:hypothetical protein